MKLYMIEDLAETRPVDRNIKNLRWINPDEIYVDGSIAFIYDGKRLYTGENQSHFQILANNKNDFGITDDDINDHNKLLSLRIGLENDALFGRVGPKKINGKTYTVFSVWNPEHRELIKPAYDKMKSIVGDIDIISLPQNVGSYDRTVTKDSDIELMKKLHLMKGADKKKAMKRLGLKPTSSKHRMQKALEKRGHLSPGQKWWAMHSEDRII